MDSLSDYELGLMPGLYALRQAIRGYSDTKLARRLWGARSALNYVDESEAEFQNVRDWVRRQRQEQRIRLVSEIAVLEAEYKGRPAAKRWPGGKP